MMKKSNPFNIRKNPRNKWKGAIISKGPFESFINVVYGTRAFLCVIMNYRYIHNITTIYDIIHRYAPPLENNTNAYINYVAKSMKCSPDTEITSDNFFQFAKAVAFFESNYILDKEIFLEALQKLR